MESRRKSFVFIKIVIVMTRASVSLERPSIPYSIRVEAWPPVKSRKVKIAHEHK